MRFAKILRFGGKRADVGIDLYDIINANTQTGYNQTFGNDGTGLWRPTSIQNARFALQRPLRLLSIGHGRSPEASRPPGISNEWVV
jgi:hypothetical protein